jgi:hypothetical protein
MGLSIYILSEDTDCVCVMICPSIYRIIIQSLPNTGSLAILTAVLREVPPCKFRGSILN